MFGAPAVHIVIAFAKRTSGVVHGLTLPCVPAGNLFHLACPSCTAAGQVRPFFCGVFPQPTPSLDYQAWLNADQPLQLQYHPYWEPFGAGPIASMPLYDERFRGYGLNKQQHTCHLGALGFKFEVCHEQQALVLYARVQPLTCCSMLSSAAPAVSLMPALHRLQPGTKWWSALQ
jgi:hypothetical protein